MPKTCTLHPGRVMDKWGCQDDNQQPGGLETGTEDDDGREDSAGRPI